MNNIWKIAKITFSLVLVLLVIYGIHLSNVNDVLTKSDECKVQNRQCKILGVWGEIRVTFAQKPVPEEELFVEFKLPDETSISSVFIEGVYMYMGKSPVMFEDPEQRNRGVFFLGSCSEPHMQWKMTLMIEHENGNILPFAVLFDTKVS